MAGSTFKTNPIGLHDLLVNCDRGVLQLPDFQRSWVWDEDRIKSLIASVSRALPIGALMTLDTGGEVDFKPRPIEGAPVEAKQERPRSLLLDGQQRMTFLYQVTLRNKVVDTVTPRQKKVKRWFYIDIEKSLEPSCDRDEAILSVPEDKLAPREKTFGREIEHDLTTRENEFRKLMYPVSMVFQWDEWHTSFIQYAMQTGGTLDGPTWNIIRRFKESVIDNFTHFQVPVIALGEGTSKDAVCTVFERPARPRIVATRRKRMRNSTARRPRPS